MRFHDLDRGKKHGQMGLSTIASSPDAARTRINGNGSLEKTAAHHTMRPTEENRDDEKREIKQRTREMEMGTNLKVVREGVKFTW